jgi:hypothetical protein
MRPQPAAIQRAIGILRLNEPLKDEFLVPPIEFPGLMMNALAQQLAHRDALAKEFKRQLA